MLRSLSHRVVAAAVHPPMPATWLVVPFRQRLPQLQALLPALLARHAGPVLVCEQSDGPQPFNRGWCKNVGFQLTGARGADTVYFHDVDVLPGPGLVRYPPARPGAARHLYGHSHCLGGVVGMTADDFARVNGFVNDRWRWGGEDRLLQLACQRAHIAIERRAPAWCRRWGNDAYVQEMAADGRPLAGVDAARQFQAEIASGAKVPERLALDRCPRGHLDTTAWTVVSLRRQGPDERVRWAVVAPAEDG